MSHIPTDRPRISDEELRRLAEAATPGPWRLGADLTAVCTHHGGDDDFVKGGWAKTIAKTSFPIPKWMDPKQSLPNGRLIAAAPDLAAEVLALRAELSALRTREAETGRLHDLRAKHAAWSQQQFGDVSAIGPAKHLSKEALEVAAEPHDVIEHADCWMLLWDMQRRAGITDVQLADAIQQKLSINMARQWPAPNEGEAHEHARTTLSQPTGEGSA